MSTSIQDHHQRNKGTANSGGKPHNGNGKFQNGPRESHGKEHEDLDSWRNQSNQGYSSMAASDAYNMPSYYGSFQQYPNASSGFSAEDGSPWSNSGSEGYVGGGYNSGIESAHGGQYNMDDMFNGGGSGSFGSFNNQTGLNYGFQGNGDYSWSQNHGRKSHHDYYSRSMYDDDRGLKIAEHEMGGLRIGNEENDHASFKEFKEMGMSHGGGGGSKKTTWASIASQPAKTQNPSKKKPGMPLPPIIPGAWETKNGAVAKAPIAAPVQAPTASVWDRPRGPPGPPPQGPPQQPMAPPPFSSGPGGYSNSNRGYQQPNTNMGYMPPPHSHATTHPMPHKIPDAPPPRAAKKNDVKSPDLAYVPDETIKLKLATDYNPTNFDLNAEGARFFVIKSYSEDDVHRSIKYEIWCSTDHGNKRLDQAFKEREGKGKVYLFFSVNGSGHFCGMAEMQSALDYSASASVWSQDKWKGQFKVKWIYVKDVPNTALRHIRLENNENKPVTNSRDTQEIPFEKAKQVLKIFHTFQHSTSIFDDFIHYEIRQKEEDSRRSVQPVPNDDKDANPPPTEGPGGDTGHVSGHGNARGGGHHYGPSYNHGGRNHPDMNGFRGREMMGPHRDFRDHRDRDGYSHRGGRGGYNRDRDDRPDRDRDFYHNRDRRGGHGHGYHQNQNNHRMPNH